jgi:putative hydrolase of the HAD superfamily
MTARQAPKTVLKDTETLMLDMDGTLLDLAFDNYVWRRLIPERYAARHKLPFDEARRQLFGRYGNVQGDLKWYCLDHWSEQLDIDVLGLHRDVHHRIGYLPGAEAFLEEMHARHIRVILVTNSHPGTLRLKDEVTGLTRYFDAVYTSHDFGHPKEHQAFWLALKEREGFDEECSVMVDDTHSVLHSAREFGIRDQVAITKPDTTAPERRSEEFVEVESVSELAFG